MLSIINFTNSIRWIIPALFLFGTAPTQVFYLCIWKALTILFPRYVFDFGDDVLWSLYQKLVLFFYEYYANMKLVFYHDARDVFKKKENILFIMNHQSALDWTIVDMLAARQGRLGQIRYILKYGLRYFPLYGAYFYQHSCIYVKRGGNFDEKGTIEQLREIDRRNINFWLTLFPEGTRYNPDNQEIIARSERFADAKGLQVLEHHLTPRTRAAWLCVHHLRHKIDAIYDVTALYGNCYDRVKKKRLVVPGLTDYFNKSVQEIHLSIKRIDMQDIPNDESEFKKWMHKRFIIKDNLFKRFYSNDPEVANTLGDFSYPYIFSFKKTLSAFLIYIVINVPLLCTEVGRMITLSIAIGGSILGCIWMMIAS